MDRKLLIPLVTIGIFIVIINMILVVLAFMGKVEHNPILETIGLLLLILYSIDKLKNYSSKQLYLFAGLVFIFLGIFI
ncbi:hypothetical protein [Staphylococcus sp. 11261D007BR]